MKIQEHFQSSHSGQSFTVVGIVYFDTLEEKLEFIEKHKDILHSGYCGFHGVEKLWREEGLYDGGGESEIKGHAVPVTEKIEGYDLELAVYFEDIAEQGYTIRNHRSLHKVLGLGEELRLGDEEEEEEEE